eukprot:516805-Pelagomonas_calceolata.AAC.6
MQNILPSNPKSLLAIGSKLLLDQAIMAPAGTASFFAGMKASSYGGQTGRRSASPADKIVACAIGKLERVAACEFAVLRCMRAPCIL